MRVEKNIMRLRESASVFDAVSQRLFDLAVRLEENPEYNAFQSMSSIDRLAESATVALRHQVGRFTVAEKTMFMDETTDALGIAIEEHDAWLKIKLPGIIPHRNARDNPAFLTRPMRHALIQFQRQHPIERFSECVICVEHQYDEALGTARIHDYDNIETKRYLDVIESVFLTNDSGLLCSVLQTTKLGDQDAAIFYIMPPWRLPEWAKKHIG